MANVLRTDIHARWPLPADRELAQGIAVLARAQQDAVWDRVTAHNKLRCYLRVLSRLPGRPDQGVLAHARRAAVR